MDGRQWAGCMSEGGQEAKAISKPPDPFEGGVRVSQIAQLGRVRRIPPRMLIGRRGRTGHLTIALLLDTNSL